MIELLWFNCLFNRGENNFVCCCYTGDNHCIMLYGQTYYSVKLVKVIQLFQLH